MFLTAHVTVCLCHAQLKGYLLTYLPWRETWHTTSSKLCPRCEVIWSSPSGRRKNRCLYDHRSFTYASPYLWNQLPSSFRQPHSVHSPPGSPHPAHITSSQSSPSFSPSFTPSSFHSRLKPHLFHKSFPPSIVFLVPSGLTSQILNLYCIKWALVFVCLSFFFLYVLLFMATCATLS